MIEQLEFIRSTPTPYNVTIMLPLDIAGQLDIFKQLKDMGYNTMRVSTLVRAEETTKVEALRSTCEDLINALQLTISALDRVKRLKATEQWEIMARAEASLAQAQQELEKKW